MLARPAAFNPNGSATAHLVQLFDSDQSLSEGVAQFLHPGLVQNEQVLVVMNGERWNGPAMRLAELGSPVDEALRVGRLIVRSAGAVLKTFMVGDRPHPQLFAETVGTLVAAAFELEELWNELVPQHSFTMLCGYTAGHFGDPRNAADLRRIRAAHSAVVADPHDALASFLVKRSGVALAGRRRS